MPECGPPPPSIIELQKQLQDKDSRLSAVEASVRDAQNNIQIWSNIVRDGLADLSVQVRVAMRGLKPQTYLGSDLGDDSQISMRLSEVEKNVKALQVDSQESSQRIACKMEQKLQELQENVQEMPVKLLLGVQEAKLQEYHDMLGKLCVGMERFRHSLSSPNLHCGKPVPAASFTSQQPTQSPVTSPGHPGQDPADFTRPSSQQMSLLPTDRVPQLPALQPPLWQLQTQVRPLSARAGLIQQNQGQNNGFLSVPPATPIANCQTVANHIQQPSCAANRLPIRRVPNSNQREAELVSPQQRFRTRRASGSSRNLVVQPFSSLLPSPGH